MMKPRISGLTLLFALGVAACDAVFVDTRPADLSPAPADQSSPHDLAGVDLAAPPGAETPLARWAFMGRAGHGGKGGRSFCASRAA